ncbi:MAG: nucleoside triphosphate pyrophosphohydrolase family protein [Candidatus Kapaibacterium sp.]
MAMPNFRLTDLMTQSPINIVKMMHAKFGINYEGPPRHLTPEEKEFRIVCLSEELTEYQEAITLEDELDALIDLIVFSLGTLERHGFAFTLPFMEVMNANLQKKLAESSSESKRGFEIDLVKPKGWLAPNMKPYTME